MTLPTHSQQLGQLLVVSGEGGEALPRQPPPAPPQLPTLHLDELKRLAVELALLKHGGNKSRAAQELGISVRSLYNQLARYAREGALEEQRGLVGPGQ